MIIDLCCGIGRFEKPGTEVISIDINPVTKPTILADIKYLPLRRALKPDLVHASPPCKYFSIARQRRWGGLNSKGIADSLKLVAACFDAFNYLAAKNWTLENPLGFLSRLLNETRIEYQVYDLKSKRTCFYTNMKSLKRSVIPQDIRQQILKNVYEIEN